MKTAFYTNEKQVLGSAKVIDYFSMEERLLHTLQLYDMSVNYSKAEAISYMEKIRQPKIRRRKIMEKYVAFFNGHTSILDTRDILFLESYYRKASVVMRKGRYRIRARLDEEEKKLPKEQFVRINRHNIINMKYVRNVRGEKVEMQNGDVLYVNNARKKNFEYNYRMFLKENCLI